MGFKATLRLKMDRQNFPIAYQLEFIELLESFSLLRKQDAFLKVKEIYEVEYGNKSIQVKVCDDLIGFHENGRLDLGFEKWFNKDLFFMYRVTEYIKDRSEAVDTITKNLAEQKKLLNDNFIVQMMYPLFVLFLLLAIVVGFHSFMFPILGKLFKVDDINEFVPLGVQYIGGFVTNYSPHFILFLAGFRYTYIHIRNNWVGDNRDKWSQWFPFIIYRHFQSAKLLHSMAMMRSSGLSFIEVLKKLDSWVDPYLQSHVKRLIKGTVHGKDKKTYFGIGLFSSKQLTRLRSHQENGGAQFEEALKSVAKHANNDAAIAIRKFSKRIQLAIYAACIGLGMCVLKSISSLMMMVDI